MRGKFDQKLGRQVAKDTGCTSCLPVCLFTCLPSYLFTYLPNLIREVRNRLAHALV